MKRIVTHLLVATGLAMGAVGVAQAHTDLHIGLSLGVPAYAPAYAPAYVQPAPVYVQAAPVYRAPPAVWIHRDAPRWDGPDRGYWNHAGWNHGGEQRGWGDRRG
jgi:hypothetical protein